MNIINPYFSAIHMAKTVTPRKLATKAIRKLNKLRNCLKPVASDNDVHQFRVQFKKTRAFFRMANAVEEANIHRMKKSWHKIYQATGELRDVVIIITAVKQQFEERNLINYLQQKQEIFALHLQQELIIGKPFSLRSAKWRNFTTVALDAYFEQLLQPIRRSYRSPIADHSIHEIRKNLKDFLYNLGWLDEMGIVYPPAVAGINTTDVEHLLELLGNYQNEVVLSSELRQLKLVPELHAAAKSIDLYLHQLAQDQVRQYHAIIRSLEHIFHLHASRTLDE